MSLDEHGQARATGLFRLIRDSVALRSKPRTDIAQDEAHRWLADLPAGPSCRVSILGARSRVAEDDEDAADASAEAGEVLRSPAAVAAAAAGDPPAWVVMDKLAPPPCPPAPAELVPWFVEEWPFAADAPPSLRTTPRPPAGSDADAADDAADAADADAAADADTNPGLADAPTPGDEPETEAAEPGPPPAILTAHERFISESWEPWSRGHAAWVAHDAAYTALFAMVQELARREEDLELIVGLGLLAWAMPEGETIRRHLVSVPATFDVDLETGRISVVPAADLPAGETDMLPPNERPEQWARLVAEAAAELDEPPHDGDALDRLFATAANALGGGRGTWSARLERPDAPTDRPRVTLSPALVLRRRGRGILVERTAGIVEALEAGTVPSAVIRRIAGGRDEIAEARERGEPGADQSADGADATDAFAAPPAEEVLLPLPSNDEQVAILSRLRGSAGVLVQGPPGTGKSHTIANLMCHLLASGRRVLVSAQSPRALTVLRDKLPEEIRPLCIALLGNDGRALDELASSVATIVERCEEDPAVDRRRASQARSRRETLQAELEALDEQILERRRVRQQPTAIEGTAYRGTPDAIARQVAAEHEQHAWLETGPVDPEAPLPEEADELPGMLATLRSIEPARRAELAASALPDPARLPDTARIRDLVETEANAAARLDVLSATSPEGPDPDDLDPGAVEAMEAALSATLRTTGELEAAARNASWINGAVKDILAGSGERWRERLEVARGHAEEIAAAIGPVEDRELTIPEAMDRSRLRADAQDLLEHLARGKSVGAVARLMSPVVRRARYVMDEVRVDGRACDRRETLEALLESLDVESRMRRLDAYLSDLVRAAGGPQPLRLRFAALRRCLDDLEHVARLVGELERASAAVSAAAASWLTPLDWSRRDEIEGWRSAAAQRIAGDTVAAARAAVDAVAEELDAMADRPGAHALVGRLAAAVGDRDLEAWQRARGELDALRTDASRLGEVADRLDAMPESLMPLARALVGDPEDEAWDEQLAALPAAWDHARARAWLERLDSGPDLGELNRRARRLQDSIERETTELVAALAWTAARERLDEDARRTLQSWVLANRNLGRGTGRYATRRRRKAGELLERCREAVPGWIMPLYRVYEQVDPTPGAFDVVIVDEASQCGIEAVHLGWLASQLVVVGDDEQISPTVIIERDPLYQLAAKHLDRDPIAAVLEPDTSLFDLGRVWFDDPVRLREHFRCMPEIIGFSDRLAYDGRLVPLRQAPPDRLDPVRTVHVPDGVRVEHGGEVTNPPEADAMVDLVARCHEDPAYAGRTFGVVSLLGERQARLVESKLARRIGPEAMTARRLVCGDAYSFQGDERDVMFLGLVAARTTDAGEPVRNMPLVRRDARQRFNVAMSRGCDQVWLVHSVQLEDLPNPDDLRRRLLEYCLDPGGPSAPAVPPDEDLHERATSVDRDRDPAPSPFSSWLAVDVHRALRRRGYRVLPAYAVAGGRIDLVVTDGHRLVAVACEGESRRDVEEIQTLLSRRRRLERAGWRYLDVAGTRFHLDRQQTLNELWSGLEQAGVRPVGD